MNGKINLYEMLGLMTGDGCIRYYPEHRVYSLEVTGNADDEVDYFEKIAYFLKMKFQKKPRVYVRYFSDGKALKLELHGKHICEYFMKRGITRAKTYTAEVPSCVKTWKQSRDFIRGLFEADGSLYFSKSKKIPHPSYPRLEIKTASPNLALGVYNLLYKNGFNVQFRDDGITNRIYLSGEKMLYKWVREIGFSSEKNLTKYYLWKKLGYYIPCISLNRRKTMLTKMFINSPHFGILKRGWRRG